VSLKLWKIYQDVNGRYDTFDSAVVVAKDADAARLVHPGGIDGWDGTKWKNPTSSYVSYYSDWAPPQNVGVSLIGLALPNATDGEVICASFNAG